MNYKNIFIFILILCIFISCKSYNLVDEAVLISSKQKNVAIIPKEILYLTSETMEKSKDKDYD